jgi:hypothetical protein
MNQGNSKFLKYFAFGTGLFIVLLIGLGIYKAGFSAKLNIVVTPKDSVATVNGKKITPSILRVKPGSYTIKVTRTGFTDYSATVTATKGVTKFVGVALIPNSPQTANWYTNNPADQLKNQQISSQNFDIQSEALTKSNPLIQNLPFIDERSNYRIDYGFSKLHPDDTNAVAIYITTNAGDQTAKDGALGWLHFMGYDPAKLEIIYSTFSP